ncbi:SseB family protein, partial [Deltaproteobacteria bacterium OttesenSCG-928-M10]|nr:SseB family protein [Deltaproteobacteria bacterium OttesenSCG-928-M10]
MDEKQEKSIAPPHALELALKNAVSDPGSRPQFYKALMESSVFVVGKQEAPDKEGEAPHIHLKQWQQPDGSLAMPFFATAERLKQTLGEDEPIVAVAARDLFRMSGGGLTLVFTTAEGAKAFKPDEISALVSMGAAQDPLTLALIQASEEGTEEARRNFYNVL